MKNIIKGDGVKLKGTVLARNRMIPKNFQLFIKMLHKNREKYLRVIRLQYIAPAVCVKFKQNKKKK